MTGTVINPVQVTGMVNVSTAQTLSPSYVNSFRISAVTDRLQLHLRGGAKTDNIEFFNLCLSLARGIDYAVANNEVPSKAPDLPYLLKQVCQRKNDTLLEAAIMVLMISVKSACGNRWFSEKETEELHLLSNEIGSSFCSVRDFNTEESTFYLTISTIMSRFYPRMKMGEILAFVEAKPGYGAFVKDFHISKNAKSSPNDKIYLFVAQTDNIETSSCIVSPQQVNFLLNGRAVDRRTCIYKDPGPQVPTPVTHMLKYGTNLLQAVGQFNGNYIIAVAFMSVVSNPSCPAPPDYALPASAAPDSDNEEIIEGPSRISLNCPISFRRIKTPVKGHLCKHLQCFDFDNYVDINSRRPSWRCPHCSQSVCFHDVRIDQSMVKVLKEVGENVSYVKISADGSWEAVTESDDHTDRLHEKTPLNQESTTSQNVDVDILDLTGDNEMDTSDPQQNDDCKPSSTEFRSQSNVKNPVSSYPDMGNLHGDIAPHMQDEFWRGIYLSSHATGTPSPRSDVMTPVTGAVASALNREPESFQESNFVLNTMGQSQIPISNNMQLQPYNNSNNVSNEYARYPTPARYVTRTPIAIQALPAQPSTGIVGGDRQQQFSRSHLNPHQISRTTSAQVSHHMSSQNWVHQDRAVVSNQPAPQLARHSAPPQSTSGYRYAADHLNPHQQQSPNHRIPTPMRSSAQSSPQIRQGGAQGGVGPTTGFGGSQQPHYTMATAQRAMQIRSWTPSIPAPIQTSGSSMAVASVGEQRGQGPRVLESSADASAEQSWRPTGRMRGSLSGRAYSDALNQFIIQPTQPVQAARPPVLNTTRPVIPPHLQVLMANSMNAPADHASQGTSGSVLESSMVGGPAGVLPDQ